MDKIALVTGHCIPRIICKYFPIDSNLLKSLDGNYLWFSDPQDFNDPYDCNLLFDTDNNAREIRDFITREKLRKLRVGDAKLLQNNTDELVNRFLRNPNGLRKALHAISKRFIDNYGICCFSEDPYELLLWSHYADKHRGVCIKFDINQDLDFFRFPLKVDYPANYPLFNYIRASLNPSPSQMTIQFFFATKPYNYRYETEVRIIKENATSTPHRGAIKFRKEALIEVVFGYKTSNQQMKELHDLITSHGYNPKFSVAVLKDSDFGLETRNYRKWGVP